MFVFSLVVFSVMVAIHKELWLSEVCNHDGLTWIFCLLAWLAGLVYISRGLGEKKEPGS